MAEFNPMAKPDKRVGRPPVPGEKRTRLVQFYLTETDAAQLIKVAKEGGFRGYSSFLTALVEPIIQGGLSLQSAARSLIRIQRKIEGEGLKMRCTPAVLKDAVRDLFAPPPPIPDEPEDVFRLRDDLRDLLAAVEAEISRNQTTEETP